MTKIKETKRQRKKKTDARGDGKNHEINSNTNETPFLYRLKPRILAWRTPHTKTKQKECIIVIF